MRVTNIILITSIIILGLFILLGLIQLISRKSIKKVDKQILWLPVPLLLMAATYFIFDKLFIFNTRPDGSGEPSFPSTHVMIVTTIFFLVTLALPKYVKSKTTRFILGIIMMILISLTAIGRVMANKHYPLDVIAGIAFGFIFSEIYYLLIKHKPKKKKNA